MADITARGFGPGTTATFFISTTPSPRSQLVRLGVSAVDANGVVTEVVTIPGDFETHSVHSVQVQGVGSDRHLLTEYTKIRLAGPNRGGHGDKG
jgi:hypothetical protein